MNAQRSLEDRDQRLAEGVLPNAPLFRGLPGTQLAALARQCWVLRARRGEVIARRGARLPGVLVVAFGTVKLSLRGEDQERVLRLVSAGQSFGEPSALTGLAFRCEAQALSDCKLIVVPGAAALALIERDPRMARRAVEVLAERSLRLVEELESSSMRNGAERLAHYLETLANGTQEDGPCRVRLPASKTVVASALDMKKETLSRLFRSLSEQGLIRVMQREVALLDRERLRTLSGQ